MKTRSSIAQIIPFVITACLLLGSCSNLDSQRQSNTSTPTSTPVFKTTEWANVAAQGAPSNVWIEWVFNGIGILAHEYAVTEDCTLGYPRFVYYSQPLSLQYDPRTNRVAMQSTDTASFFYNTSGYIQDHLLHLVSNMQQGIVQEDFAQYAGSISEAEVNTYNIFVTGIAHDSC